MRLLILLLHLTATFGLQWDTHSSGRSFISSIEEHIEKNSSSVSQKCSTHMTQWGASIAALGTYFVNCNATSMPKTCAIIRKQLIEDNFYALRQLDSFGKLPANLLGLTKISMGDFDECLQSTSDAYPDYSTHYCWAHLNVPVQTIVETIGGYDTSIPSFSSHCGGQLVDVKWSVCLPRTCSEEDIQQLLSYHFDDGYESVCRVSCRPIEPTYSTEFYVTMACLALLVGLVAFATLLEHSFGDIDPKKRNNSKWTQYVLCFSLISNGRGILKAPKSRNIIVGTECIRIFSFSWVICFHMCQFYSQADNAYVMLTDLKNRYFNAWFTAVFSVDSFFLLSGTMLSYSFLAHNTPKTIRSGRMWLMFYVHRYIRLSVPYFTFMIFYVMIFPLINQGPHEYDYFDDYQNCHDNWWTNVLYINNIVHRRNKCIGIAWYLASEMQMFVFSPLILVPFVWSPMYGLIAVLVGIGISIASTYINVFTFDLAASLMVPLFEGTDDELHYFMLYLYEAFYVRMTAYLVGIFLGYALLQTKTREVKLSRRMSATLWTLSTIVCLSALFVPYNYQKGTYWTPFQRATYYAFSRLGWALGVGWVIFAINRGHGGIITRFMSLSFWHALGRLSYCAYMVHMLVGSYVFRRASIPVHYEGIIDMYIHGTIPVMSMSLLFAVAWSLLFEVPTNRIEALVFSRRRSPPAKKPEEPPAYTDSNVQRL